MLNFIGIGSAFHTALGNNSAFVKEKDHLLLLDCGGTVFHELQELGLLEQTKQVYIAITHTHPDHVGSLGEVIFYCYYILGFKPTLIFRDESWIRRYLEVIGVLESMYDLETAPCVTIQDEVMGGISIQSLEVKHVDTMPAYGLLMHIKNHAIYYSGDASNIPHEVIEKLETGQLERLYQDTCGIDYEGNAHLYIGKLAEIIKPQLRDKVYCMHLDRHIQVREIKELGFNVVTRYQS